MNMATQRSERVDAQREMRPGLLRGAGCVVRKVKFAWRLSRHGTSQTHRVSSNRRSSIADRRCLDAFTLIELMVVVAILAVVMTMAIPSIYQTLHKDSLRAAVSDVMEMCSHARAYAIRS